VSKSTRVWLHGIAAALVSGASTGVAGVVVAPELTGVTLAKMAALNAVIGVALYLKQSPLPPEDAPPETTT
jgi:hypothetical protein